MELLFIILAATYCSCNLIKNVNVQNKSTNIKEWTGNGCELVVTSDDGHLVIEAKARQNVTDGPSQYVHLKPDSRYSFEVYVKQVNDVGPTADETYKAAIRYTWNNGIEEYRDIAIQPEIHSNSGWFSIKTVFITPNENFTKAMLSLHGPQAGIIFHATKFTLDEIPAISNWAAEADKRINTLRKKNVHFTFSLEPGMNPSDIKVKIDLQRHLFGFGAMADIQRLKSIGSPYQMGFYSTFNWATVDGFGWPTQPNDNTLQHNDTVPVLRHMKENGLKIRGQSFFQGQPPSWVEGLSNRNLKHDMRERINYVDKVTRGLIDQWEIFEDRFEDIFYKAKFPTRDMDSIFLTYIHMEDPFPSLHINEMDVLVSGNHTWAYSSIAKHYADLGLNGIGAKSPFINADPDPWLLKHRLDLMTSSGIPIWITDLEIDNPDEDIRATLLENALRIYFSHPDVEGITLKNFFNPVGQSSNSTLFEEVEVNGKINATAAGRRFLDLINMEWSTHMTRNLGKATAFTESCFKGSYYVQVYFNGTLVGVKPFTLDEADTVLEIHLTQDMAIAKPTTTTGPLSSPTGSSVAPDNLIASTLSQATHDDLQCVTRWSDLSDPGDDKTVDIGCQGDEILTGYSSSKVNVSGTDNKEWFHDGEFIIDVNGSSVCRAYNGFASQTGVFAVARCCSARQLSCQYLKSGSSQPGVGSTVETTCPAHHVATGCSGLQKALGVQGVLPNQDLSGCLAVNGETHFGVFSAASCCSAPGLKCMNVTSSSSLAISSLKVTCEEHPGTVMTSCHALSSGKIKGVYITDSPISACTVSSEEKGIEAVAVCCLVDQTITLVG